MKIVARSVIVLLILAVFGGGFYLYRKDVEFRRLHGRVVPVSVLNWTPEVEQIKDNLPVLLYFHSPNDPAEQREIVERFAWNNAGKVKVVSIDTDRPENLLFAARFVMVRQPGFVVLFKNGVVRGYDGKVSAPEDLSRLLHEAANKR